MDSKNVTRTHVRHIAGVLALVFGTAAVSFAQPRTASASKGIYGTVAPVRTAFSYQGRIDVNGSPVEGRFDFTFALYDASTGGTQVGAPVTANGISVAQGVFDTLLDFGNDAYASGARWLEVAVSPEGANAYETLAPRTPITAVPVALSLPNVYADPVTGFVGIGAKSRLTGPTMFQIQSTASNSWGGMYVATSGENGRPFYGYSLSGTIGDAWHEFDGASREWRLVIGSLSRLRVTADESRFHGDVGQEKEYHGLVKAGARVYCSNSGSYIYTAFNNVTEGAVTVQNGGESGTCSIDFGFDISQRYWSANPVFSGAARSITCDVGPTVNQLECRRFAIDGSGTSGAIMVTIF